MLNVEMLNVETQHFNIVKTSTFERCQHFNIVKASTFQRCQHLLFLYWTTTLNIEKKNELLTMLSTFAELTQH